MKNLSILALLMAVITFAACSSDEIIIDEQTAERTFTLVVNAAKGDAATRALTLNGTTLKATWAEGEVVTVFNVTRNANLTGTLTAQSSGPSTTLSGSLTGTIANGDELKLKFLSPSYTSQNGTLASIATTCDYAEATVTVNDASTPTVTTTNASFTNQQAIVKFTLKDKATDAALSATKLTVTAGGMTINVTPALATDVLYVAIPAISSQTVYLSATAGSTNYIYEKADVTLTNGKYYGFTVKMEAALDTSSEPLTFEAKVAGATVTFTKASSVANQIEYSTDGNTWITYSEPIILTKVGDKVYFRGNNAAYGASSGFSKFSCSNECYVYGNIMSLVNSTGYATATELTEDYTFSSLFKNNTNIYNHSSKKLELPAITLTNHCYNSMFNGCTSLTVSPDLPATTLAYSCYFEMFRGCTSLTTAPAVLPAVTLGEYCCRYMFYGCINLTTAPELPATTLARMCYKQMFLGCTGLTSAPTILPATTLTDECYFEMFSRCSSLTTAPKLPATTLVWSCYYYMFYNCTNLNKVECLATDISATNCTDNWLYGVSSSGTFTKASSMTSWTTGASGIPSGWTVVSE